MTADSSWVLFAPTKPVRILRNITYGHCFLSILIWINLKISKKQVYKYKYVNKFVVPKFMKTAPMTINYYA